MKTNRVTDIAAEYKHKQGLLRKKMIDKLSNILTKNLIKARDCKVAIKALKEEKDKATDEISMATQHIKELKNES